MTADENSFGEAAASDAQDALPENGFSNSTLFQTFLAERAEIQRHKWIESEKAGHDIGSEQALVSWIVKHRSRWFRNYQIEAQRGR